jgi:hypothetical protein
MADMKFFSKGTLSSRVISKVLQFKLSEVIATVFL